MTRNDAYRRQLLLEKEIDGDIIDGWYHSYPDGHDDFVPPFMTEELIRELWKYDPHLNEGSLSARTLVRIAEHVNTPTDVLHNLTTLIQNPDMAQYVPEAVPHVMDGHPNLTEEDAQYIRQIVVIQAAIS